MVSPTKYPRPHSQAYNLDKHCCWLLSGFYRGISPGVTGSLATGATYFGVIESTKTWLENANPNLSGHWSHFIAGAIGKHFCFIYLCFLSKIFMVLHNMFNFILVFYQPRGLHICTKKTFLASSFISHDTLLVQFLLGCMMPKDNFLCWFLDTAYIFFLDSRWYTWIFCICALWSHETKNANPRHPKILGISCS